MQANLYVRLRQSEYLGTNSDRLRIVIKQVQQGLFRIGQPADGIGQCRDPFFVLGGEEGVGLRIRHAVQLAFVDMPQLPAGAS